MPMDAVERGLLEAIGANPDDDEPRLVYADWLSERGDPRGELITLLCIMAAEPERRPQLELGAQALVKAHGTAWFGPLGVAAHESGSYWFVRLVESMSRGFFARPLYVTAEELERYRDLFLRLSPVLYVMDQMVVDGHQNTVIKGRRVTACSDRVVCIKRPARDTLPNLPACDVKLGNDVVLHEARVLGILDHPNTPRLEGVGQRGDGHVVALEWIDGWPLGSRRGPLPAVVELIAQLCRALHHLHAVPGGAVHSALRPDNVMVTADGQVKLIDFGRTWLGGEPPPEGYFMTGPGVVKSVFDFLSPEVAEGRDVTPASDIFSIGALLYALACGQRPFTRENDFATLRAIIGGVYAPPRSLRPDLPPAIEAVIQRALQRDPAARFPTAMAMHDTLLRIREAAGWQAGPALLQLIVAG
jgi:uncharacterized protein (TIGR02996 family)